MLRICFIFLLPLCISNQQYSKLNDKPKELSDAQRWALGASGMLASRNHMKFDSLAGCKVNEFNTKQWQNVLKRDWSVENREGLLQELKWLEEEGHSAKFENFANIIAKLKRYPGPTVIRSKFEKAMQRNKELKYKIAVINKYHEFLGDKSLNGWDATRYICLCRWGFICGYLTEDEAWKKIIPVARFIQETFDSWEDLGTNYIIGREYWSPNDKDRYLYKDAYMKLLEMLDSPWKKFPWNLPLGENIDDSNDIKGNGSTRTGMTAMNFVHSPLGAK